MRRWWWWAAGVVALAAVAVLLVVVLASSGGRGGKPSRAVPPPSPRAFGANVGRLFNDRTYSAAAISSQLAALRATGAALARSDAFWEATEPLAPVGGRHRYDWTFDDTIAAELAAHGLRWSPVLDYSAVWARAVPDRLHSPPASPAGYAAYAAAFAARYGPDGSFWVSHPQLPPAPVETIEIWNEPDNPVFWSPAPDAGAYADLYLTARRAIHAVDPAIRVIVGGLTNPTAFLPAMLRSAPSLAGAVDGVAIHPYGVDPAAVLTMVAGARRTLTALGMAEAPLYVTEFGWPTSPPSAPGYVPAAVRPGYIRQAFTLLARSGCRVAAALLYAWVTPERNPANREDWFGINPPGGGGSPDVTAFAAGMHAAGGSDGAGC